MNINKYFPKIAQYIDDASDFERNQMICAVEKTCINSHIALVEMTNEYKKRLENDLIENFKFKNWIKK